MFQVSARHDFEVRDTLYFFYSQAIVGYRQKSNNRYNSLELVINHGFSLFFLNKETIVVIYDLANWKIIIAERLDLKFQLHLHCFLHFRPWS